MNPPLASTFKVYTNADAETAPIGGDPKDREMSSRVLGALHALQDAMDAAALAGLIIEPAFKQYANRFKELGSDMESYVAQVEIYRKLA
jgi:hypothetical protein